MPRVDLSRICEGWNWQLILRARSTINNRKPMTARRRHLGRYLRAARPTSAFGLPARACPMPMPSAERCPIDWAEVPRNPGLPGSKQRERIPQRRRAERPRCRSRSFRPSWIRIPILTGIARKQPPRRAIQRRYLRQSRGAPGSLPARRPRGQSRPQQASI